ncbi:MAG: rod shape-determining protein MreC [Holosporaceae bacterium]|jgi:rod shape-determining protein MreC|nr:rod shape-determining protein MreC [Holosporaceae bacterium]
MAKKNTHQRNFIRNSRYIFKKLRTTKAILQLIAAILLLIMLHLSFAKNMINNLQIASTTAKTYISESFTAVEDYVSGFIWYLVDANKVHQKLRQLQMENLKLQEENRNLSQLLTENVELRRLTSMIALNDDTHRVIVARVVAKLSNDYTRSCVFNVGSSDGVVADNIVKNIDGLVGRIVEVHENWCRAMLITDMKSSIPVKIGKNNINAIASGNNSGLLQVTTIHEDITIHSNDTVMTSGYGNIFRDDVPVGKVIKKGSIFFIEPAVNFNELTYGCILK